MTAASHFTSSIHQTPNVHNEGRALFLRASLSIVGLADMFLPRFATHSLDPRPKFPWRRVLPNAS